MRITDAVSQVVRDIADELVLPRFRALCPEDVSEKAPGDLVTVVDREVEERLESLLLGLIPGSRFIGEERTSGDRSTLEHLESG